MFSIFTGVLFDLYYNIKYVYFPFYQIAAKNTKINSILDGKKGRKVCRFKKNSKKSRNPKAQKQKAPRPETDGGPLQKKTAATYSP
ncbi:hypothetical protein, partial [Bacteroides heparinolyticus]